MRLQPGTLPCQSIESSQPGLGVSACMGILPCFRLRVYPFVVLKHVYHMVPGQFHCSGPSGYGRGFFVCSRRVMGTDLPVGQDLLATRDWCPLLKLIWLCLFSVWAKCFSIQCLCDSYPSWWPQTMVDRVGSYCWWQAFLSFLLYSIQWDSFPAGGDRRHVLDSSATTK